MRTLADLRTTIRRANYIDENVAVRALLAECDLSMQQRQHIMARARDLVQGCRKRSADRSLLDLFLQAFGLSTEEGIAMMCVAEALLRIPDQRTAEELIADKLGSGNWTAHTGTSDSLFVNASTWALMLTGSVISLGQDVTDDAAGWIRGLVGRLGENVARAALVQAMRILGNEFVLGRNIHEALERETGISSFDMLGEAARTWDDADRYLQSYLSAIDAIAATHKRASTPSNPIDNSGISVKLSALHPRFELAKRTLLNQELAPRVKQIAMHASVAGIHLTLDAEELERIDPTLDVFEALARDPDLEGWKGLGMVVQAYAKNSTALIDWIFALAGATNRDFMIRLVKGAYWDAEIKRSQVLGLPEYPVFTRKASTDLSYLVCAQKILAESERVYPQFATHNAHTIAAIVEMAEASRYEFQRLHGMGLLLYDEAHKQHLTQELARVYAPVGEHKNLLAYLVRRLLENGANSSFVNRFLDDAIAVTEVVRDPVADVSHRKNVRHPHIPLPRDLYGSERLNAAGIDLRNGWDADEMTERMSRFHEQHFAAAPIVAGRTEIHDRADAKPVRNPARHDDVVGTVIEANGADVECALARASESSPVWDATPATERASILEAIANLYDCNRAELIALLVREAGKTVSDALAEVREAIDFCRYYATQCVHTFAVTVLPGPTGETNELTLHGRGVFACISPWNFPLAIFTGQISAALAAGNAVIAKPAPQTPLISHTVIRLMHRAGVPADILHLLPGGESVGKHLVNDPRVTGVAFTGSTDVARTINQNLADRPGAITTLIAETGGQNAMVVDSSALLEQVVDDVIASAFGAAGQRCSALRVVYVQDDIADEFVTMLTGAMDCLHVGDPWLLATDIGPVIDADAATALEAHSLALAGSRLHQIVLGEDCREGTFIAPTIFELESIKRLDREHFGPMLHVVRFHSERWRNVLVDIHAAGYGLTFGVHSRIDRHTAQALRINRAGNAYVNRNMIGAVVGVQPFGGAGLSGTGPKAGGPHYLARFATERVVTTNTAATGGNTELLRLDP